MRCEDLEIPGERRRITRHVDDDRRSRFRNRLAHAAVEPDPRRIDQQEVRASEPIRELAAPFDGRRDRVDGVGEPRESQIGDQVRDGLGVALDGDSRETRSREGEREETDARVELDESPRRATGDRQQTTIPDFSRQRVLEQSVALHEARSADPQPLA